MESWYNDCCPFCGKRNWWCNGDESDLTQMDVEAVKCWNCKRIWSLEDQGEVDEDGEYFVNIGDGREKAELGR